jgi:hypothetical protein
MDDFMCARSGIGVVNNPSLAVLTDLSNSFLRGETCRKFRIKTPDAPVKDRENSPEKLLLAAGGVTALFIYLVNRLENGYFEDDGYSQKYEETYEGTRFVVYAEEAKGIRTFSAAHLDQIKPLSSLPKKWTVRLALRAALSGQVSKWHVDGIYTDDYAFDNAYEYQRGELSQYLAKARRIWENPSGWNVRTSYKDGGDKTMISLDCHNFDTNTLHIDLDAEAHDIDYFTCLRHHGQHPADYYEEELSPQAA